jgi:hypothetical protein
MFNTTPPPAPSKPKMHPALRGLLGLLLLLPACVLCSCNLFLLSFNTLQGSFQKFSMREDASEYIGLVNYQSLFENKVFMESFGFTVLQIVVRLLAVAVLPLLLAHAVNTFGKKLSLGIRMLFTLPLAFFSPALVMYGPAYMRDLWGKASIKGTFLLLDGTASLAVACALGLVIYSAALRGGNESNGNRKPLLITLAATLLGTIAFTLQSFNNLVAIMPNRVTTLGYHLYITVRNAQGGLTYSISQIMLLLVSILGIVATALIVGSKLQLSHEPRNEADSLPAQNNPSIPSWVAIVLGGIATVTVTLIPLLMSVTKTLSFPDGFASLEFSSILRMWGVSVLPPLLVILFIQLPIAYLGGLAIGAMRPFGKFSNWLLLLFSPWLFVTSVPLAFATFELFRKMELLNSPITLTPPILLSVPMLFIFTLFFSGQSFKWQKAREEGTSTVSTFFKHLILPSLPLAVFMAAFSLLASTQDLFMPLLSGLSIENHTATTNILMFLGSMKPAGTSSIIALFGLPLFIVFFIVFAALQVFYLNRLVLVSAPKTTE